MYIQHSGILELVTNKLQKDYCSSLPTTISITRLKDGERLAKIIFLFTFLLVTHFMISCVAMLI